jgi:transcription elongation GreA/GreB family factor
VNKAALIRTIIAHLREQLAAGTSAARATSAAATDPDSKAENKYDTRNLEASYLARGQAFRVAETMEALREFESLTPKPFAPDAAAGEGALVSLSGADGTHHYFIGPAAGGTEVSLDGTEVMVITPASPLGAKLMRRRRGEHIELQAGRLASSVMIAAVQ